MDDALMLQISNHNSADEWFDAKQRAECLRRYRREDLAPWLAAELAELERAGF
jgi:hypothetical protein